MLVLSFQPQEKAYLDFSRMTVEEFRKLQQKPIEVSCQEIRGDKIRSGFEAPKSVGIYREPVWEARRLAELKRQSAETGLTVAQLSNIVWCSFCQRNHAKPVSLKHAADLCCVNKEWLKDLPREDGPVAAPSASASVTEGGRE